MIRWLYKKQILNVQDIYHNRDAIFLKNVHRMMAGTYSGVSNVPLKISYIDILEQRGC